MIICRTKTLSRDLAFWLAGSIHHNLISGLVLYRPSARVDSYLHRAGFYLPPENVFFFLLTKLNQNDILNWNKLCSNLENGYFFKKNGPIRALFHLFPSFQTNVTILTTNKCEKCPPSIRRWDLNSQLSDYKSPPLTTRPPPWKMDMIYLTHIVPYRKT